MTKKTRWIAVLVALASLPVITSGAWADENERAGEDIIQDAVDACQGEIDSYCSQVTPGDGRLLACFYAHQDKIGSSCEYALYNAAAELEQFLAALTHLASACIDDIAEHCAEVEVGEARVASCLLDHQEEVSEACRTAIDDVGLERIE